MPKGWVKLHRKIIDSRVFANEGLLKVWIYCLCRANHETVYVPISTGRGESEIKVKSGQFIFGRKSVARDLRMNPSTLYKRMKKLEDIGNINMQSNTHYTVVSICKWGIYQDSETKKEQAKGHPSSNQVATKEQPSNTDKNDNNVKNDKNIPSPARTHEEPPDSENPGIGVHDHNLSNIRIGGVLVPQELADVPKFAQAYEYWIEHKKGEGKISKGGQSIPATQQEFATLLNWKRDGHNPVEIIRRNIHRTNRSLYLIEADNEQGKKNKRNHSRQSSRGSKTSYAEDLF